MLCQIASFSKGTTRRQQNRSSKSTESRTERAAASRSSAFTEGFRAPTSIPAIQRSGHLGPALQTTPVPFAPSSNCAHRRVAVPPNYDVFVLSNRERAAINRSTSFAREYYRSFDSPLRERANATPRQRPLKLRRVGDRVPTPPSKTEVPCPRQLTLFQRYLISRPHAHFHRSAAQATPASQCTVVSVPADVQGSSAGGSVLCDACHASTSSWSH
jgi:hypothetical protein